MKSAGEVVANVQAKIKLRISDEAPNLTAQTHVAQAKSLTASAAASLCSMDFRREDFEQLRTRLRFKVCYEIGFFCPDVEDIVQETLTRFLIALKNDKVRNLAGQGAFLNGVCRNVVSEYRRSVLRAEPMLETVPEPAATSLPATDLFEMREAIARGMEQLSVRDRQVLVAFYLEEKTKDEILRATGMTDENFRVVLCRAKERFRKIYLEKTKHRAG